MPAAGLPDALTIAVASDIHYLSPSLRDNGQAFRAFQASGDGRQVDYVDDIVQAFVRDLRRRRPEVLVVSGDLTNNGEQQSHLGLAQKMRGLEQASGTRIFVVPGNHDTLNPWARRFEGTRQHPAASITRDDFKTIYEEFGYAEAISADSSSLSYLAAASADVWLLMLDTNDYRFNRVLGRPGTRGVLADGTPEWITQCSRRATERGVQIITVMHHNLVDHSELLHRGYTLDNGVAVTDLFDSLGLKIILSGHLHIQDIRRAGGRATPMYDIATGALSVHPQQFGVLKRFPSGTVEYSTARVDVEGWAREEGVKQEPLRTFNAFSERSFIETSYTKTYAALTAVGGHSEREKQTMARTMSLLNAHYFAGTTAAVKDSIVASEGYRLWTAATEPAFLRRYVLSMVPREAADHNHLISQAPPAGKVH